MLNVVVAVMMKHLQEAKSEDNEGEVVQNRYSSPRQQIPAILLEKETTHNASFRTPDEATEPGSSRRTSRAKILRFPSSPEVLFEKNECASSERDSQMKEMLYVDDRTAKVHNFEMESTHDNYLRIRPFSDSESCSNSPSSEESTAESDHKENENYAETKDGMDIVDVEKNPIDKHSVGFLTDKLDMDEKEEYQRCSNKGVGFKKEFKRKGSVKNNSSSLDLSKRNNITLVRPFKNENESRENAARKCTQDPKRTRSDGAGKLSIDEDVGGEKRDGVNQEMRQRIGEQPECKPDERKEQTEESRRKERVEQKKGQGLKRPEDRPKEIHGKMEEQGRLMGHGQRGPELVSAPQDEEHGEKEEIRQKGGQGQKERQREKDEHGGKQGERMEEGKGLKDEQEWVESQGQKDNKEGEGARGLKHEQGQNKVVGQKDKLGQEERVERKEGQGRKKGEGQKGPEQGQGGREEDETEGQKKEKSPKENQGENVTQEMERLELRQESEEEERLGHKKSQGQERKEKKREWKGNVQEEKEEGQEDKEQRHEGKGSGREQMDKSQKQERQEQEKLQMMHEGRVQTETGNHGDDKQRQPSHETTASERSDEDEVKLMTRFHGIKLEPLPKNVAKQSHQSSDA